MTAAGLVDVSVAAAMRAFSTASETRGTGMPLANIIPAHGATITTGTATVTAVRPTTAIIVAGIYIIVTQRESEVIVSVGILQQMSKGEIVIGVTGSKRKHHHSKQ